MNKSNILKQQRLHRGDPEGIVLSFIVNYSGPARLMHTLLTSARCEHDILQAAMRAYIIGIAACLETFFRDLYLHLLRSNPELVQRALKENGLRESVGNLPKYLANSLSVEEFALAQVSFQSAAAIDKNFSIFFDAPMFSVLDAFELLCEVPSAKQPRPARLKLFLGWQDDIERVFFLRHEFAHDANSTTQVSTEEMRRIETTSLILCQMIGFLPKLGPKHLYTDRHFPAVLLISDLIAEDWELVDDQTAPK